MPLGIYKPGQGYWVRVLTATFAGVLLLAAAAWLWGQLELASGWIPVRHWQVTVSPAQGTIEPGQQLALVGEAARPGQPDPRLGVAEVRAVEPIEAGVRMDLVVVELQPGADPTFARSVAPVTDATLQGPVSLVRGVRMFEPIFLQGAGVGLLLLIGAILIYYYVAYKPGSAEFLIATDGEMKKVNWSTRRDIIGSTWVVIVWAFMIAAGLFVVDLGFSRFFIMIGVLER